MWGVKESVKEGAPASQKSWDFSPGALKIKIKKNTQSKVREKIGRVVIAMEI